MKSYVRFGAAVLLAASFFLLSGFRAQTIIHDDGSETQDVLKVSDTAEGQKALRRDADEFQKRNYTIMDYDNVNGEGFRAMKTITKEGANRSSIDRIVHKTHDGIICSTYYIDYTFGEGSLDALRLGMAMEENDVDLEYIVSFPSGTEVTSNSMMADEQGSTYMWSLKESEPAQVYLQATVWHKLVIYLAFFAAAAVVVIVLLVERRRRSVISWKQASRLRRVEMMLLCIPVAVFCYMGYEYYVGTRITAQSLERISAQQQEELLERRKEDKRIQAADAQKQRTGEEAAERIRRKTADISSSLRDLNRHYQAGIISRQDARSQAEALAGQARDMLAGGEFLSQADKDVLQQLVEHLVEEANSIGEGPALTEEGNKNKVSEEHRRADALGDERRAGSEENDHEDDAAEEETAGETGEAGTDEDKTTTDEPSMSGQDGREINRQI